MPWMNYETLRRALGFGNIIAIRMWFLCAYLRMRYLSIALLRFMSRVVITGHDGLHSRLLNLKLGKKSSTASGMFG
jgi:hypothetical protein